jgi:hypothetical protein
VPPERQVYLPQEILSTSGHTGSQECLLGGVFRYLWRLRHLDRLIDKVNQKLSVVQILKSVHQALTSDNFASKSIFYNMGILRKDVRQNHFS